jgi:hypothetical protein
VATIGLKIECQIVLEVPDDVAARMTKQDVCDTCAALFPLTGSGADCSYRVEPNFGAIPADEATVCSADDAFENVED